MTRVSGDSAVSARGTYLTEGTIVVMDTRSEGIASPSWLVPNTASLVALTRSSAGVDVWEAIRFDPGALLLLARQLLPCETPGSCLSCLHTPNLFIHALELLNTGSFVDWSIPAVLPVYHTCVQLARLCEWIAEQTARTDTHTAWIAGMLAPLGWLTVCSVNSTLVEDCLTDPFFAGNPQGTQRKLWGTDNAALARRLTRQWNLPDWLGAVIGHLGIPAGTGAALGADPALFHIVQLAVASIQEHDNTLHLAVGAGVVESAEALHFSHDELTALERKTQELFGSEIPRFVGEDPKAAPLLRDLLQLAAENRRLAVTPTVVELERDIDHLQDALSDLHMQFSDRLEHDKLNAIAEFASGAGHEINNPLAVISGQAQYLLRSIEDNSPPNLLVHEGGKQPVRPEENTDPDGTWLRLPPADTKTALQKVIQQVQRIHDLLRQLMQFARPAHPQKAEFDLTQLVQEVLTSFRETAVERRVQLREPTHPTRRAVFADLQQVRTALTCLIRNAVEAAGAEGWVQIRLEVTPEGNSEVVVEDSGSGPDRLQRMHMFEPFYSGRQAGRGRGLGLPMAWRLAREQGGSVRFVPLPHGPTRFVLSLPALPASTEKTLASPRSA